jgi:adenine-specific DNA-methyltransferase
LRDPPYRPDHSRAKENRKGQEIGGLVPHITLKSIANTEPPAREVLVDRPEEASEVACVPGPFALEATIAPVQPLEPAPHQSVRSHGATAKVG